MRHGKRRYATGSTVMADCAECGSPICEKHAEWDSPLGAWVCRKHGQDRARTARRG